MSFFRYLKKLLLRFFSVLPSEIKIAIYRMRGANIGKNVEIGFGSYIIPFEADYRKICIGDDVTIEDGVKILAKHITIRKGAQIKDNTRIWGQSDFRMGERSYIDQECHFDLRRDITLGNSVVISGGTWMYTHMIFHSVLLGTPYKFGAITIGDFSYLGGSVFVLPAVTIGHDAMVGARSVVTKDVCPDAVVVGNPARVIGKTSERTSPLNREDKEQMVKSILQRFATVYDGHITVPEKDSCNDIFLYDGSPVWFKGCISTPVQVSEMIFTCKKPLTLISFEIPIDVCEYCMKHSVTWIDLASGKRSRAINTAAEAVVRFFGDYGITILST
jgi:acetyltransferase-like isoleucine patch superfamily enzyme